MKKSGIYYFIILIVFCTLLVNADNVEKFDVNVVKNDKTAETNLEAVSDNKFDLKDETANFFKCDSLKFNVVIWKDNKQFPVNDELQNIVKVKVNNIFIEDWVQITNNTIEKKLRYSTPPEKIDIKFQIEIDSKYKDQYEITSWKTSDGLESKEIGSTKLETFLTIDSTDYCNKQIAVAIRNKRYLLQVDYFLRGYKPFPKYYSKYFHIIRNDKNGYLINNHCVDQHLDENGKKQIYRYSIYYEYTYNSLAEFCPNAILESDYLLGSWLDDASYIDSKYNCQAPDDYETPQKIKSDYINDNDCQQKLKLKMDDNYRIIYEFIPPVGLYGEELVIDKAKWIKAGISGMYSEFENISPNNKYFATATRTDGINIIDVSNGNLKAFINKGLSTDKDIFAFSSDSKFLLYQDYTTTWNDIIKQFKYHYFWNVFDIEANDIFYQYEDEPIISYEYAFTVHNNQFLMVDSYFKKFMIWDLNTHSKIISKDLSEYQIAYAYPNNPKNEIIAISYQLKKVFVFDQTNFSLKHSWKTPKGNHSKYFSVSKTGRYVAIPVSSEIFEHDIYLYEIKSGKLKHKFRNAFLGLFNQSFNRIGFSGSDDKIIYSTFDGMLIVNINEPNDKIVMKDYVGASSFFYLNKEKLIQCYDGQMAAVVNIKTSELEYYLNLYMRYTIDKLDFSYQNKYVGVMENYTYGSTYIGLFHLIDVASGKNKDSYIIYDIQKNQYSHNFLFVPDRHELIYESDNFTITFFDYINGYQKDILYGHTDLINSINFSSDGKYLITSSNDSTIKIWDVNNKNITFDYKHSASVSFADFTSYPSIIMATLSYNENNTSTTKLSFIDMNTKQIAHQIDDGPKISGMTSSSLDKNKLLNGNIVWDLIKVEPVAKLEGERIGYYQTISSDGSYALSSKTFSLGVYSTENGRLTHRYSPLFNKHLDTITGYNQPFVFTTSSDSKYIVAYYYNYLVLFNAPQTSTSVQDDFLHTLNDINLYPNPATEHINIEIPNEEEFISIAMFNLLGELVWQSTNFAYSKNINIPVETLTSGMYILKLTTNKQTYSKYFVKHK